MNKTIEEALNKQINAELFSSYLYLSMASYFETINLTGFSKWMKLQAEEELTHAMKFFDYVNNRGGKVILDQIDKPETEFSSPLNVFKKIYEHEQLVTEKINNLYKLSLDYSDYAFQSFLKWFIDEQVEEESSVSDIIEKIKLAGESGPGLFMVDQELSKRSIK